MTADPSRLALIQRAHRIVAQLEAKGDLDQKERVLLQRAYAARGSLRSNLNSPEQGLRDLLRAHALYSAHDAAETVAVLDSFAKAPPELTTRSLFDEFKRYEERAEARRAASYDDFVQRTRDCRAQRATEAATDPNAKDPTVTDFPLPPWTPYAELGEAFRVYARDVLLSKERNDPDIDKVVEGPANIVLAIRHSIICFERALRSSEAGTRSRALTQLRAWILAHRAASFTMLYWLARSSKVESHVNRLEDQSHQSSGYADSDLTCINWVFEQAETGFSRALEEQPKYAWCSKFRAFLLALRGKPSDRNGPSDYFRARNLLRQQEDAADKTNAVQTSFHRSLAMLYSYDAVSGVNPEDKVEAAERSLEAGITAAHEDPDEFLGPYFAVGSQFFLARKSALPEEEKGGYETSLQASLDAARVRARNALSQAMATLAGLQDLQQLIDKTPSRDGIDYHKQLAHYDADWETRAFFARDPVSAYAVDDPEVSKRRKENLELLTVRDALKLVSEFKAEYLGHDAQSGRTHE